MARTYLWIVIIIVMAFLGFMIGYAVPPFMEVGFGGGEQIESGGAPVDEELKKEFEQLYQIEEGSTESE